MQINILFLICLLLSSNSCDNNVNENIEFSKLVMSKPDTLKTVLLDTSFLYNYKYFFPKREKHIKEIIDFIKQYFNNEYDFASHCEWIYSPDKINRIDSFYKHEITYKNLKDSAEVYFVFKKRKLSDKWKLSSIIDIYLPTWDPLPGPIYVDEE